MEGPCTLRFSKSLGLGSFVEDSVKKIPKALACVLSGPLGVVETKVVLTATC